eukprot:Nitzschia sp. Nitz4//scaffold97_size77645//35123//41576//NITZ4_005518-RA/size77645-processed-gene-0.93-mRNA-1//-1//CDS//3329560656//938//frame0
MASLLGFGSPSNAKSGSNESRNKAGSNIGTSLEASEDKSPHYHFLHSMILPSTVKIQKELRGRKFKEVQAKLGEAVMGLHTFQYEAWPPEGADTTKYALGMTQIHTSSPLPGEPAPLTVEASVDANVNANADTATTETSAQEEIPVSAPVMKPALSLDDHFKAQDKAASSVGEDDDQSNAPLDTESVVGDFPTTPGPKDDDGLKSFDDVTSSNSTVVTHTSATTATTATTVSAVSSTTPLKPNGPSIHPNSASALEMHPGIVQALEAYTMVMMHPQKTNKACEEALSCATQLVVRNYVSGKAGGKDDESGSGPLYREKESDASPPPSLLHQLMVAIQKCGESNAEGVQNQVVQVLRELLTCGQCSVHEASMLLAIRSIFHVYLVTKAPTVQKAAKSALSEMVSTITLRMECPEVQSESKTALDDAINETIALYQTDTYYLMRSLVKLSSRELPGIDDKSVTPTNFLAQQFFTSTPIDPLALNNKVLSLELLLTIMEYAGDVLCYGDKFVHLVQSQLCVALIKNCMSNHSQVAFLSQKIFFVLVHKFKAHLHDEIQGFMKNIFFRVLDSDNSSFEQKALVLESLRSVCNQPRLLTQIFLNYDCDMGGFNLYKDIVLYLTKLSAKAPPTGSSSNRNKKDIEEQVDLRWASLEVLVSILHTMLIALGIPPSNMEMNDIAGQRIRDTLDLASLEDANNFSVHSAALSTISRSQHGDKKPDGQSNNQELTVEDLANRRLQQVPEESGNESMVLNSSMADVSANVAGRIVDAFESKRLAEQNFELGVVKFTLSIKSGLNFFIDNGFCSLDAKEIALFFLDNKEKLDKTQIGEVLGKEPDAAFVKKEADKEKGGPGFYVAILHHYIQAMDFAGLMFDDAIRLFLSGFRLPGEAQKIDRIMEAFAERFTVQNVDVFPNADTAFILAFSVIMLNTDLHNPSIKPERRMTLESFLRNNKGIGENGSDLDKDFLTGIFNRIKAQAFSLKEDDAAREKAEADAMQESFFGGEGGGLLGFGLVGAPSTEERKRSKFKKEQEEMMSATTELLRRRKRKSAHSERSELRDVDPMDVVRPMFDVTWGAVVGILSQMTEMSNDEGIVAVCLNGFVYAIRIAARCNMPLARNTFINSLTKFTLLGSMKEMKPKNIEAIRTLITIASVDGEYLAESWGPVLQCISTLARMRTAASGLAPDGSFLEDASNTKVATPKPQASTARFIQPTNKQKVEETLKEAEESNQRAVLEFVSEQLIDKVFSATVNLSASSLLDFMRQLVLVATAEIEGDTKKGITGVASAGTNSTHGEDGPSIFCLQRLVEVADYNRSVRPRLVWTQVWEILGDFFFKAGCHRNAMVSVFAIDSLKQLSSKFLEQPELSEFHFQRTILKPFLMIMQGSSTRQDIRELILQCVDQTVSRMGHNLQSGWGVFFDIVKAGAHDKSDKIALLSLNILQRMLDNHLDQLTRLAKVDPEITDPEQMSAVEKRNRNSNADDFLGMCQTSLAFIQLDDSEEPRPLGVAMRALCHMAIYADIIAGGVILPPCDDTQHWSYTGLEGKEAAEMALWRPLLEGLARGVRSTAKNRVGGVGCLVQRGSILALRSVLLRHGALLSKHQLEAVMTQTIIPAVIEAAEIDDSPVVSITSDSPALTSIDFLAMPLPVPPPRYDQGLLKFEEVARGVESAPARPLGASELLLEACFADMRHGGDGNLSNVYKFAKKDIMRDGEDEQPFPDSWIATTAPIALGFMTDIVTEIAFPHGDDGVSLVWPPVAALMKRWCTGDATTGWMPCEALVRISCFELNRLASRLALGLGVMDHTLAVSWANSVVAYLNTVLSETLKVESETQQSLLEAKINSYNLSKANKSEDDVDEMDTQWVSMVPALKVKCIAVHLLQQALASFEEDAILSLLSGDNVSDILQVLSHSRELAESSVKNEDLAHAFQEAVLSQWGDGDEMGEEALVNIARLSQTQGSPMFFLTQAAGATEASVKLLSVMLAHPVESTDESQDRQSSVTPHLLTMMNDVLVKFVESETKEGHRLDPNVWRNLHESGIKVAVYCTSFAPAVVAMLNIILGFETHQMQAHGPSLFPLVCRLVQVQSDEIRRLVQRILIEKYTPMLVGGDSP